MGRDSDVRRITVYIGLMLVTVAAGLAIRFAPLGLPWPVMKYGGSTLWAVMIYWVMAALLRRSRSWALALLAGGVATLTELTRLWHFPPLDAFRVTLPGVILLGRYFSVWNIVAYWVAIALGALADQLLIRGRSSAAYQQEFE